MKFYIGVTDIDWFNYLDTISPEDCNFWQPGGRAGFKIIRPGEPFLFKLKSPINAIAGLGFFVSQSFLPIFMAWEIFGNRNGMQSFDEFHDKIQSLRSSSNSLYKNPNIGCLVLTNPVFFKKEDWIPVPASWSANIVQGKAYATEETMGMNLWNHVKEIMLKYNIYNEIEGSKNQLILEEPEPLYSKFILSRVRLGQGAFRVLITDAYSRKCGISGERTLPVLEACHIKPYAKSGPHFIKNGILLRSDIHKLFDNGYVTVTPDLIVEVSRKIKEEFENGREYYQFHGRPMATLPFRQNDLPAKEFLEWHNEKIYMG